ncbi:Werner syndrome ATP-dependent helicase-like [Homarus americanus]|uniref:Werner syndrome ATP-dependent helicase-like n=2 Tax=Homarus americanus TaxID=6706 RepID=A0A8J5MY83_HOMAM|nr:Werner syndrome ATP-dependent helicase-like [Homarus americanus]
MLVFAEYLSETTVGGGGNFRGRGRGQQGRFQSNFSYDAIGATRQGESALMNPKCKILLKPSTTMLDEMRYVIKRDVTNNTIFNPSHFPKPQTNKKLLPKTRGIMPAKEMIRDFTNTSEIKEEKQKGEELKDPREKDLEVELYKSLLKLRNRIGDETGFMPYLVATNRVMLLLTSEKPTTLDALRKTEGLPEAKVKKFGPAFVEHIRAFCMKNNISCLNEESRTDKLPVNEESQPSTSNYTTGNQPDMNYSKMGTCVEHGSTSGWISASKTIVTVSNSVKSSCSSDKADSSVDTLCKLESSTKESEESRGGERERKPMSKLSESMLKCPLNSTNSSVKYEDNQFTPKYSVPRMDGNDFLPLDVFSSSEETDLFSELDEETYMSKTARPICLDTEDKLPEPETQKPEEKLLEQAQQKIESHSSSNHLQLTKFPKGNTSKKKGVSFDTSDTEEEGNSNEDSQEKYERIISDTKRKLKDSGWIDARKMKKKMRQNSLFR